MGRTGESAVDEQWLAEIEAEHQPWGDPRQCQWCSDVVGVSDSSGVFDARPWPCAPYLLVAEVRRLREALKPFAHHSHAGDDRNSEQERSIRVTVGQVATAWFMLEGGKVAAG